MPNLISITFFLVAILICCTMLRRGADALSPARVFGLTWCVVFGLANLKLSRLQFAWTPEQWMYALLGPASFIIGLSAAFIVNIHSRIQPLSEMRRKFTFRKINDEKLFLFIIIAFITYIAGYLVIYLVKGYIPMFAFRPGAARIEYFIFGVGLFIHNMPIIVIFILLYHQLTPGKQAKKAILKVIGLVTIITYIFLLQRYQLIMISVMTFAILYYTTRYIRFKTVLLFLAAGILIIYAISSLRTGQFVQAVLFNISQMKISYRYAVITEPYMYIVMNVENFVHAVGKLDHHTYGLFSFDFLFALTGLKYWIREYFALVETPYQIGSYNTYTIFWTPYRDFGIAGVTLLSFIGGGFVGSVYYAMRRNPTVTLVLFYSLIVFIMVLSFFLNPLGFLWFVYIVGWMAVILKFVRIREPRTSGENAPLDASV